MHDHVKTHNVCSDPKEASVAKHIHNRPLLLLTLAQDMAQVVHFEGQCCYCYQGPIVFGVVYKMS